MSGIKNKLVAVTVTILGLVFIFLFCGLFYLETPSVQKQVQKKINTHLPGEVSWKKLKISPFPGRIEVEAFQLKGPDKKQLALFKRMAVNIAWLRLLKGEISFSSVLLESPQVTIEADNDGTLDIARALQAPGAAVKRPDKPSKPFPFNVTIGKIVVADGAWQYTMPGKKISNAVSGFSLLITGADLREKRAVLNADINSGSISGPAISSGIELFKTHLVLDDGSLSSLSLDVAAGGIKMGLNGSIKDLFTVPVLDIKMDTHITLHESAQLFQDKPTVSGTARIQLAATGSIKNPEIGIKAGCGKSIIQGQAVEKVDLELVLKNRFIRLLPSRIETPAGHLSLNGEADLTDVFPEGYFHGPTDFEALSYLLLVEQSGTDLSTFLPDTPGASGSITSHLRLNGKGIDPERLKAGLVLDLTATKVKTSALSAPIDIEIKADAGFEDKKVILRSLTALTDGIRLFGKSEFEPGSGMLAGTLDLKVNELGPTLGLMDLKGTGSIDLSVGVTGSYLSPDINLDLKSDNLGLKDVFIGDLALKGSMDKSGRALIDRLTLENKGSRITATGWADLFANQFKLDRSLPMDIRLLFHDVEIPDFLSSNGLKGFFSGSSRLTGSLADPKAVVAVSGKGLALAPYTIGDASLNLNFSGRTLFIDDLRLTNRGSLLAARGSATILKQDFSLMEDPEFELSLTGGSLFLADFSDRMKGQLTLNGRVKGTTGKLYGNLDLAGSKLDLDGQNIHNFSLKTVLEEQTVTVKNLDIQVTPEAVINGKGWASFADKRFELALAGQDFPLTALDLLSEASLTGGRMSMDLSCAGTIDNPVVRSQIAVRGAEFKNHPMEDIDLSIDMKNKIARVKGRMGALIEGAYHLDDNTFVASADMESLDLSPYFTAVGQDTFSGNASGTIRSSGRLDDLQMIQITANLKQLDLRFKQEDFIRIPGLTLSVANGKFSLPEAGIMILGHQGIKIKGEGSLREDIHIELKGRVPFKAITPVVEEISDATGDINLSALIKGTFSEPKLTADLKLDRLGMSVSGIEQKVKGIDGIIRITPEGIDIDRFSGRLDDGSFDLSGTVGLNGLAAETYQLNFNARQLFLAFPDLMDITLSSSLSLMGDREKSDLKGEITLLDGRYVKEVELDLAGAADKKREFQPMKEKQDISFLEKMALAVDIRHREPFWVDNNLALLSILPNLKLSGTAAAPLISGRAEVDEGTITFQRNEFEVRKGIVDFINPYKIEPFIDVEADLEVRSWAIYLTVSGTPDNLDFTFRSTPEEQHADILSLLAFGKTTRELQQEGGGSVFSPEDILAGFIAETLQKNIKDASGIDYLEIESNNAGDGGGPGVNVLVGKDLSRQMTVKYGVDVRDGETVQRMITDYKLLETILMRGFQDTGGHFGGEIKYRLEFR